MSIGEKFKREVELIIPRSKRLEQLEKMAKQYVSLRETEAEKRKEMAERNQELKDLRAACDKLGEALKLNKFTEEVECEERLVGKQVHIVRVDTGAVVEKRPATDAELQVDMFTAGLGKKTADEKPKKKRGRKPKAKGEPRAGADGESPA